jgi:hypothetical protein
VSLTQIGLEIKDISLHEKNGQRWLSMPSRSYYDANKKLAYAYILDWTDETKKQAFQSSVLRMLDGGAYGYQRK